ncbi:hypothetical protein [Microcoleus sp. Pol17_C1]|uniref:hypothetical protein n=1 Tax=unclassified Microcoleus TaxID=2642155 RepID=UPI002FD6EFE7
MNLLKVIESELESLSELTEGNRVVVKDVGGRYHGVRGMIISSKQYATRTGLTV